MKTQNTKKGLQIPDNVTIFNENLPQCGKSAETKILLRKKGIAMIFFLINFKGA